MAASAGIPISSYHDLEAGHDWFQAISLDEICSLSRLLDLDTAELLIGEQLDSIHRISFETLRLRLIQWLEVKHMGVPAFEEKIGWGVQSFLEDAGIAKGWNLDCLRAVCEALSINWTDVSFCREQPAS
jgi:hypothetical protein